MKMSTVRVTRTFLVLSQDFSIPTLYFTKEDLFATPWFSSPGLERRNAHFRLLLQALQADPDSRHLAVLQVCSGEQRDAAIAREVREGEYCRFHPVDPAAHEMVFSRASLAIQGAGREFLLRGARLELPCEHSFQPFRLELDARTDPNTRLLVSLDLVVVVRSLSPDAGSGEEEGVVYPALSMSQRPPVHIAYTVLELDQEFSVPTVFLVNVEEYATPWFSHPELEKRKLNFRVVLATHGIHDFLYAARLELSGSGQAHSAPRERLLVLEARVTVAGSGSLHLKRGTRLLAPSQHTLGAIHVINPPISRDPRSRALISFRAELVVSAPAPAPEEPARHRRRHRVHRSTAPDTDTEQDLDFLSCHNWRCS